MNNRYCVENERSNWDLVIIRVDIITFWTLIMSFIDMYIKGNVLQRERYNILITFSSSFFVEKWMIVFKNVWSKDKGFDKCKVFYFTYKNSCLVMINNSVHIDIFCLILLVSGDSNLP